MPFPPARLVSSALMAALLTWLMVWQPFSWNGPSQTCYLELSALTEGRSGLALHIDEGHGYGLPADDSAVFEASKPSRALRLKIPPGRIHRLKVHVFYIPKLLLVAARLRMSDGRVLANLMGDLHPLAPTVATAAAYGTRLEGPRGSAPFAFEFTPPKSILVPTGDEPWATEVAIDFLALAALFVFGQTALAKRIKPSTLARWSAMGRRITGSLRAHPALVLCIVALAASVTNSFPVVFGDKSLVSPNSGAHLLYSTSPTLPGAPNEPVEDTKNADIGAVALSHLPYSVLESKALFVDHELPLWHRYNSCGVPLLGQGQSMFGDPLHFIPLLAGGAWWAWDVKYVLAKALFALGIGLCVWSLTRRLGLAALLGASSVWIGFFAYRYTHPGIFSLCYAPWVLLPWLWALRAETPRQLLWPAAALILADWSELTSGTAKEASMLLLSLNAVGFLIVAAASPDKKARLCRLGSLVWASLLFLLLSAPDWLVFLDALKQMRTSYVIPLAYQLQPGLLAGFFDEIFTQDFTAQEQHLHPSLNFLVFSGVLWFGASWQRWRGNRTVLALVLAVFVLASLVFGIVPPAWITATPGLANIYHIHNTFGCALIVLLLILAGIGFQDCIERSDEPDWIGTWQRMLFGMGIILLMYLGFTHAIPRPLPDHAGSYTLNAPWHSRFFVRYVPFLIAAAASLPWVWRGLRSAGEWKVAAWAGAVCCLIVVHFRHGMYEHTRFDAYVMNPRTGFDLNAASPAIDRIKRRLQEPYRTSGTALTLAPGYSAMLGLEGVTGSDALTNPYVRELGDAAGLTYFQSWRLVIAPEAIAEAKPIYDLLNLRFYLSATPLGSRPGLTKIAQADLGLYESKEVWPRAFFTNQLGAYQEPAQLAQVVKRGDGRPFAAVQGTPPFITPAAYSERQIVRGSNYRLTTNTTEFSVTAPSAGVAVLTESYEEGNFKVTVNGAPAPYFRVNHAFKGVWLSKAGDYRIRFSYWPRVLTAALWLSTLGLALTLLSGGWLATAGRGRKKEPPPTV